MKTIQLRNGGTHEAGISSLGNAYIPKLNVWVHRSDFKIVEDDEVTARNRALSRSGATMAMRNRES
jgi:hypothetical protein